MQVRKTKNLIISLFAQTSERERLRGREREREGGKLYDFIILSFNDNDDDQ